MTAIQSCAARVRGVCMRVLGRHLAARQIALASIAALAIIVGGAGCGGSSGSGGSSGGGGNSGGGTSTEVSDESVEAINKYLASQSHTADLEARDCRYMGRSILNGVTKSTTYTCGLVYRGSGDYYAPAAFGISEDGTVFDG